MASDEDAKVQGEVDLLVGHVTATQSAIAVLV